jgi:hypothetical protein
MRFNLRDLFWLTLVTAVVLFGWRQQCFQTNKMNVLIRTNDTLRHQVIVSEHRLKASQAEARALEALHSGARDQLTRLWRDRNSSPR